MASKPAEHSSSVGEVDQVEQNRPIAIRRVPFTDHSQLPADYSATPGGTLFSTTPGGTRIIYDREFLLQFRNSPLAKNPPPNLPSIPGVTQPEAISECENQDLEEIENMNEEPAVKETEVDPDQFAVDI